jgi:hypothetical protein
MEHLLLSLIAWLFTTHFAKLWGLKIQVWILELFRYSILDPSLVEMSVSYTHIRALMQKSLHYNLRNKIFSDGYLFLTSLVHRFYDHSGRTVPLRPLEHWVVGSNVTRSVGVFVHLF